jgi:predicted DNA-binding transcriptional regulator AlpA
MTTKKVSAKPDGVMTSKLGPQRVVPIPTDAVWITTNQVLARYGGMSQMWLHRKLENNPSFPKPVKFGRLKFWRLSSLEAYEQAVIAGEVAA